MADEIKVVHSLDANKGNFTYRSGQSVKTYDMTGTNLSANSLEVTTDWTTLEISEAISLGDPGWATFQNLDDVETIELGAVGISEVLLFAYLEPGAVCSFPLATTDIAARCISTTATLDFRILER